MRVGRRPGFQLQLFTVFGRIRAKNQHDLRWSRYLTARGRVRHLRGWSGGSRCRYAARLRYLRRDASSTRGSRRSGAAAWRMGPRRSQPSCRRVDLYVNLARACSRQPGGSRESGCHACQVRARRQSGQWCSHPSPAAFVLKAAKPHLEDRLAKFREELKFPSRKGGDVTFEMLNREDFLDAIKAAFPRIDWDKAYKEFRAAGEKEK
jgi:hypothetical protein